VGFLAMTEQESLLEFPCRFPIKVMGRNQGDFKSVVTEIITRKFPVGDSHHRGPVA
jgi:putative lipoic acid-binding regulatory protein